MKAFYNEKEPEAAAWLQELSEQQLIPPGTVDSRSIKEITYDAIQHYDRAHFFCGIGGWGYALELSHWGDIPVWTGSCPCQPFSDAGKQLGYDDPRHLWPVWRKLIRAANPPVIFGEQVASKLGREWLAGIRLDLEEMGYEVGAADLCAAGVGSPHIRQRLYWSAYRRMDHSLCERLERQCGDVHGRNQPGREHSNPGGPTSKTGCWDDYEIHHSHSGKARRVQPGISPMDYGLPARVGRVRCYGNSIVPELAAKFIIATRDAYIESCGV